MQAEQQLWFATDLSDNEYKLLEIELDGYDDDDGEHNDADAAASSRVNDPHELLARAGLLQDGACLKGLPLQHSAAAAAAASASDDAAADRDSARQRRADCGAHDASSTAVTRYLLDLLDESRDDAYARRAASATAAQQARKRRRILRGDIERDVSLCTAESTYSVRFLESSNSLLLHDAPEAVPAGDAPAALAVRAAAHGHLECVRARPRFGTLRALLADQRYDGEDAKDASDCASGGGDGGGWAWHELVDVVHASERELRAALLPMNIVCAPRDARYRMIDDDALARTLESALDTLLVLGYSARRADAQHMRRTLVEQDGIHPALVHHVMRKYFAPVTHECAPVVDDADKYDNNDDGGDDEDEEEGGAGRMVSLRVQPAVQCLAAALLKRKEEARKCALLRASASSAAAAVAADASVVWHSLDELLREMQYRLPNDAVAVRLDNGDEEEDDEDGGGVLSAECLRGVAIVEWLLPGGIGGSNAAAGAGTSIATSSTTTDTSTSSSSSWSSSCAPASAPPNAARRVGKQRMVRRLVADELPLEPRARIAALFDVRAEWTRDELEPYLRGVSEAVLRKYARVATQAGTVANAALARYTAR